MNRRNLIKMDQDEIELFLNGRNSLTLGTINADGTPNLVAMWYGFFSDGSLGMWTFAKSQKVVNLRRDSRLTCLVETGSTYNTLAGVEIKGVADLSDEKTLVIEIGSSIYERYFGILDENGKKQVEIMSNKRVAIKVVPEKIISWDHAKLGGTY